MNCDICGREISTQSFKVVVEGAKMLVCSRCQRLGKPDAEVPTFKPQFVPSSMPRNIPRGVVTPKVTQRRAPELPRGMAETDIVEDYPERVRSQRMKLGLSQDQLAKRVKEKLSVIQKVETGKMAPNTKLCRELEHQLKIKLLVPHRELSDVPNTAAPVGVTLGDIIRIKGKSSLSAEA